MLICCVCVCVCVPQQGVVRLQCVRALQGLYQEKDFIGRLELFTSRFKVGLPSEQTSLTPLSHSLSVSASFSPGSLSPPLKTDSLCLSV